MTDLLGLPLIDQATARRLSDAGRAVLALGGGRYVSGQRPVEDSLARSLARHLQAKIDIESGNVPEVNLYRLGAGRNQVYSRGNLKALDRAIAQLRTAIALEARPLA